MLNEGQIDGAWGFAPHYDRGTENFKNIDRYGGSPIIGNARIRRLFSDGGRSIITDYHQKTGIIPVNHMVVVKQHILDKYPWLALELLSLQPIKGSGVRASAHCRRWILFLCRGDR